MSSEVSSESSESFNHSEKNRSRSGRLRHLREVSQRQYQEKETQQTRSLRPKRLNLAKADKSDESEEFDRKVEREVIKVLSPAIETIHSRKIENDCRFYYIRFSGKSFLNCQWVEESELIKNDQMIKNKLRRFDNAFDNTQFDSDSENNLINFDSDCRNVDRILNCSEIFMLIHPKKASDIGLKWSEKLLKVIRALINFNHNGIYIGIFYLELSEIFKKYTELSESIDFSVVLNRIYLDNYSTPDKFWDDLDLIYKAVDRLALYLDEKSDLKELNCMMRQLTAGLYHEWFDEIQAEAVVFQSRLLKNSYIQEFENCSKELTQLSETTPNYNNEIFQIANKYQSFLKNSTKEGDQKFETFKELMSQLKASNFNFISVDTQQNGNEYLELQNGNRKNDYPSSDNKQQEIEELSMLIEKNEKVENQIHPEITQNCTENEEMIIEKNQLVKKENSENGENQKAIIYIPNEPEINAKEFEILTGVQENEIHTETKQPTLLTDEQISVIIKSIAEFINNTADFVDSVLKKTYWNNFVYQIKMLPKMPKFLQNLEPIEWTQKPASIYDNLEAFYLIKWSNMSYADCTWEKESELAGFDHKIRDYKRFTRAMARENRTSYINRFSAFVELRDILANERLCDRISQTRLNELRHKIFTYKDQKNVIQYSAKNQPIYKDQRLLRSYQLESLNWMIEAWTKRRNVILADEMGLGKTIQAMSFVNHLISSEHQPGPYLVIAPLSTLAHWKRVFEDWTHLNSILYYDSKGKIGREVCQKYEFNHSDVTVKGLFVKESRILKFSVMITSFEVFIQDFDTVFKTIPFQHIIIDEAHRLKNRHAKIISILKKLVCQRIFLLTGTPIQNNLSELWSLLHFVEPGVFNDLNKFLEDFESQMKMESLQKLQTALSPYLLRRMKEEVESSIPPLTETIIDVELTSVQKIVYKTIYEKNKGTLQKGLGFSGITLMNNLEMQLRKCCNHPFTIHDIADNLTKDCTTNELYIEKLISSSGKMNFVHKALEKFKKENKKVLIFSQFTDILRLMEEYLAFYGIKNYKIDGSTKARDRQIYIDKFNNNPNEFEVFLLSTKAGGLGINLTSASVVIIFDSDWNPQNDIQAIARAHRIGQTQEVSVFRLISKKTYESEMFERASKKLGLDQAILLTNNNNTSKDEFKSEESNKLKSKEIELLLKKGIIGFLNTENEPENVDEKMGENIDDIIQNARVAKYSVINGLYSFSKANFIGNTKEEMLHIDDPDFWKKAFANQQNVIENFDKEYKTLVQSDKMRKMDVQKDFFLRFSDELYKYLNDRVTNEGFSADTEVRFCDMLIQISDNTQFDPVLRELAAQLNADFGKGARRIKKIDEKKLNALLKTATDARLGIKRSNGVNDVEVENPKRKKNVSLESEVSSKQKDSLDDSQLYENEDEKVFHTYRRNRTNKTEEKAKGCDFCGNKENIIQCKGPCGRLLHADCLKIDISVLTGLFKNEEIQEEPNLQVFDDESGKCFYCYNEQFYCFSCKQKDVLCADEFLQVDVGVKNINTDKLFKCSMCPKMYHSSCVPIPVLKKKKAETKEEEEENDKEVEPRKEFTCSQHFCDSCGIFSIGMYQCVECPFGSHKKCMSKRNQVINNFKIRCVKHITKPEKQKKTEVKVKTRHIERPPTEPKKEKQAKAEVQAKVKEESKEAKSLKEKREKNDKSEKPKSSEKKPRPSHSRKKKEKPENHKDLEGNIESDKQTQKMKQQEKEKPKEKKSASRKKIKQVPETNQKLTIEFFKPFDYSSYKKVR